MARVLLSRVEAHTGRALRFSPDALRALLSYAWPGNVRELENALEYAATVARGQTLQPEDLPPEVLAGALANHPQVPVGPGPLVNHLQAGAAPAAQATNEAPADLERAALEAALQAHRWSRAETARALGLSRSTLWRRMRQAGLA